MAGLQTSLNVTEQAARPGAPAPQTLLMAHGYGCDHGMWRTLLPLLSDHHCITFDHPGAGAAGPATYDPQRHATLQGYADTVVELAAELARPGLVFMGHSVSAMIGALAAVQAPQAFAGLVMLCPSPCYFNDPPGYLGGFEREQIDGLLQGLADGHAAWSHAVAPMIMGNLDRPALTATLADSFCAMDPTIALRWARATFLTDLRAMVCAVTTPTLVMQCREDAIAPPAVGQWLAARLPRGRLAWLDAQGHCPHMSHPDEVARVLLEALRLPTLAPA